MRQLLFVILFAGLWLTGSAQGDKAQPCDPGYCADGVVFNLDQVNFHKPRTGCSSGFGFCVRGHWGPHCSPCIANPPVYMDDDDKVHGWYKNDAVTMELHLPIALKDQAGFKNEDLSTFEVEDNTVSISNKDGSLYGYLKGGIYPTRITDKEIIVSIGIH